MKPEMVTAACALLIAAVSLFATIYFGWCTRDHNRRSVLPLPYVAPSDFTNKLAVRLWNYGCGPMVLKQVITRDKRDGSSGHLIDLLPRPPNGLYFSNYVKVEAERAVLPGKSLTLIELPIDEDNTDAVRYRDQLRDFLGYLVVDVDYTNIYKLAFSTYKRDLTGFHSTEHENPSKTRSNKLATARR